MVERSWHKIRAFVIVFFSFLAAPSLVPVPVTSRARRGAGFLEYALLGALAVGIFLVINALFPGVFTGLFQRIRSAVGI